jgi:hypothetical protein
VPSVGSIIARSIAPAMSELGGKRPAYLSSRNDFVLVIAWLLATLRPGGPIHCSQNPASRVRPRPSCRKCSRPWSIPLPRLCGPRKERELMIAASNGYLLAFDNLSGLPAWLSDALCRLASGGSFAVRQLQAARPLILKASRKSSPGPTLRTDRSS